MKVKYKVLTIIAICMMTTACEKSNNAIEPTIKLVGQNNSIFEKTRYEISDLNSDINKIAFYAIEYENGNLVDKYEFFSYLVNPEENSSIPIVLNYNMEDDSIKLDIRCGEGGYLGNFNVGGVDKGFAVMVNDDISSLKLNEKVNLWGCATENENGIVSGYDLSNYGSSKNKNGRDFIIAIEAQS